LEKVGWNVWQNVLRLNPNLAKMDFTELKVILGQKNFGGKLKIRQKIENLAKS